MTLDFDRKVAAFARARFGDGASVVRMAGDASDRTFYRLRAPSLSSMVLMAHREPFDLDSFPYFMHSRFLLGIGAPVPQIVASYPAEGILVVQDLGDETLQVHLESCDAERRRFLYLQAVRMITLLQQEGTRALTPDLPAANMALDAERLLFELRFFGEHYVRGLLGAPLSAGRDATLEEWFVALARQVAAYPRVLCHRDFHSRNLMVKGERLFMVDFQDARLGAYTYDLASLIRDSYVTLPRELTDELIGFYREESRAPEPPEVFRVAFDRTCLQRNIKAVGTFASQAMIRGNQGYLKYIGPTIAAIRANLSAGHEAADREVLEMFEGPLAWR